ncbi:MAG: hypothetical protein IJE08_10620 [Clostridia bacterium]|nr:hypothetical protein [Clostridia bacterium]
MRIKEYFYREVKEEQDLIQAEEESSGAATRSADDDFVRRFFEGISAQRKKEHEERKQAGLCMSLKQYEVIESSLLELAERVGLDIEADIVHETARICIVYPHLGLHRKEEPELMDALSQAIRSADYMHQDTCERYGETLVRLSLHFDLAL